MEIVLYLTVHIFPGPCMKLHFQQKTNQNFLVRFDCGMFMLKYINFYSRGLSLCFEQEHMPYALFSFKDRQGNSKTES
ncbi:hypothetical protein V6Z11_D02G141200 [Gossypium hirsutum]